MKKLISVALMIGLVAGAMAVPAEAAKKKKKPAKVERKVSGSYDAPATAVGFCAQQDAVGCVTIPNAKNETYITAAKATDAHGQAVVVSVQADLDGDNSTETVYGTFCGELAEPIQVDGGVTVTFWVGSPLHFVTAACAPGLATEGTIDVTFSNMP